MDLAADRRHLYTLDTLIAHLVAHRQAFPAHATYHVEIRDRQLAAPSPSQTHDDQEAVIILAGVQHR